LIEQGFSPNWREKRLCQINTLSQIPNFGVPRDDIAHGIVQLGLGMDQIDYRYFHMPPRYNTGRSHAFSQREDGPLRYLRAKYRYTANDIVLFGRKFIELKDTIHAYSISVIRKEDGTVPLIDTLVAVRKNQTKGQVARTRKQWYRPVTVPNPRS
jgi:hypothetical protein